MTRDEYVRKATERLAELRRPTVAGDIEIPDEVVEAYDDGEALGVVRNRGLTGWPLRAAAIRAGLAAAVPLIRAQVAAEVIAKAREVQAAIDDPDTDPDTMGALIDECEGLWRAIRVVDEATWRREVEATIKAGPPAPGTVRPSTRLRLALAQRPVITAAVPSTCRWHEMADCAGDAPECREARAELDGADPCGDVYADGPPLSHHACGRPSGHDGAHRCRCVGFENYTWPAGGGDE